MKRVQLCYSSQWPWWRRAHLWPFPMLVRIRPTADGWAQWKVLG